MSKHIALSMLVAVAAFGFTAPLVAQDRTAVTGAELDAAVSTRGTGDRDVVQQFLATEQVRTAANGMGISTSDLAASVATMDAATLNRLRTEIDDKAIAGGADTIVISSTVVIIALLLIILLTR